MNLDIRGKTVIFLGVGGGLDSVIAENFSSEGANVLLVDINQDALVKTLDKLEEY